MSGGFPSKQGLYDPRFEKDSCGIGMVAQIQGRKSQSIVRQGLEVLARLHHRGAQGSDPHTGDGAGILVQIPHDFFTRVFFKPLLSDKLELPVEGAYGVGMVFLPKQALSADLIVRIIEKTFAEEGLPFLGWRDVPVHRASIGAQAQESEPGIRQFFVARVGLDSLAFERRLYAARRWIEKVAQSKTISGLEQFHIVSLSARTLVYKGLLLPGQVGEYYPDLCEPDFRSAIALVHSRFSTNTFPSWPLAHPYRYLSHNGEINTIQGNTNWMRAGQGRVQSGIFGKDLSRLFPIIQENQSDSASLDNALEFLHLSGRSLAHSMMMLIPEPWTADPEMDSRRRAFYQYHSAMMEPWDGPAAVCFSDGLVAGAILDRNGLRPCRYQISQDDVVVLASEAGVLPTDPAEIKQKGRLEPGRIFLIDTAQGRIIDDEEVKAEIAGARPYPEWVRENQLLLEDLPAPSPAASPVESPDAPSLLQKQLAFGYTAEEIKRVLTPMGLAGEEATSSMGNDTPLAVLSDRPQLLFKYFRQLFAQVTNPPIDPIREQLVMSLVTQLGPMPDVLSDASQAKPLACLQLMLETPILTGAELAKIRAIHHPALRNSTLKTLFDAKEGKSGLEKNLDLLCRQAATAVREGCRLLVLSDRELSADYAAIPSLIALSAVHHHLVSESLRADCGLIIETGEARDVHQLACLLGYGAGAIHPYLALETLGDEKSRTQYIKALNKGLLKIISKMGISTAQSYRGAQIFEAIGLSSDLIEKYFSGTPSRIEGLGLAEIAEETLVRHRLAFAENRAALDAGGDIHYRIQGEHHEWNPEAIASLQSATRTNDPKTFREFSERVNAGSHTLRSLLEFELSGKSVRLEEVEPAREIIKRFTTGAMSFGALSKEAHETLAVAMNRLGAKSNSGEGGEDPARFAASANGDRKSSAIKQIASARFGVTAHYLVNARELQIKMAQGAKPGEGGQLPGPKVDEMIARLRYSTPGVQLISPPPHHDIYSIEDLAQLIFDLKNANPSADVSVKLVAEVGVGTVAAGVAKAHADKILISGDSGGTGASPLSSIKYAGIPWELGLAETHQTLVLNDLRGRVKLETDGQLKTGRDVAVAALLGAEEFGFSTAPLIVEGCIMMRKCHLNTCPVGVATQDPELRKRFAGQPEHVINYFFFVAEELRELMARLGFRTVAEMVGRTDRLKPRKALEHWKASGLDLSALLHQPRITESGIARKQTTRQDHGLEHVLDRQLLLLSEPALSRRERVRIALPIQNTDRATGTMLSGEVARRFGAEGLPQDTIEAVFKGSAGQSFGAFLSAGITLKLEGEANDYIGKGLSGGRLIVTPPQNPGFDTQGAILVGNTSLYGATSGAAFICGRAGERFAVRNSGARAVVEGTGDHGCEYMTGGVVVVLGKTGRNFAAGMSGGLAFVLNDHLNDHLNGQEASGVHLDFSRRCNLSMVELEEVSSEADQSLLHELLTEHLALTGSLRARDILEHWTLKLPRFIKVMPSEYKRILATTAKAQAFVQSSSREVSLPLSAAASPSSTLSNGGRYV